MPPLPTNQAWPHRAPIMEQAIKAFSYPIRALEIGTWFGEGSTQIWIENLQPGSTLTLVDAWRPYASEADLKDPAWNWAEADARTFEAYLSTIMAVKKAEASRNGEIEIVTMRGRSWDLLPGFKDDQFDFIYVDGDHKYPGVKKDIAEAKRLIRKAGPSIICGDDLESAPTEELIEIARRHTDCDFLAEHRFHPGVLLAIHEEFGTVNVKNGFWWIYCQDGVFTTS